MYLAVPNLAAIILLFMYLNSTALQLVPRVKVDQDVSISSPEDEVDCRLPHWKSGSLVAAGRN